MSDPFTFDPALIQVRDDKKRPDRYWRVSYPMPDGRDLVHTTPKDVFPTAEEGRSAGRWSLKSSFDWRVAQITSAHQRLTWIAAWVKEQREQRAPWTPPDEDVYEAFGS